MPSSPVAGAAVSLSVTAYCATGNAMANGAQPYIGAAASNDYPFGTKIDVPGWGVVVVGDRIGYGTQLDLYMGDAGCEDRANQWGRQQLTVTVEE